MPKRIEMGDEWFPVQAFFNSLWDSDFIEILESLLRGVGASMDVCHCDFPEDLDPGEEPFEGVRFSIYEDEKILTRTEFISVIKRVCDAQKKRTPDQARRIDDTLRKIE